MGIDVGVYEVRVVVLSWCGRDVDVCVEGFEWELVGLVGGLEDVCWVVVV